MTDQPLYHGGFGFVGVKVSAKAINLFTIGPNPQKILLPVQNLPQLIGQLMAAKETILQTCPHVLPNKEPSLEEILDKLEPNDHETH